MNQRLRRLFFQEPRRQKWFQLYQESPIRSCRRISRSPCRRSISRICPFCHLFWISSRRLADWDVTSHSLLVRLAHRQKLPVAALVALASLEDSCLQQLPWLPIYNVCLHSISMLHWPQKEEEHPLQEPQHQQQINPRHSSYGCQR